MRRFLYAPDWTGTCLSVTIIHMQNMTKTIDVDGIKVEFIRKKIKSINIRVRRDGTVVLSAPRRVSEASAEAFVREKKQWVERALSRTVRVSELPERRYESGETVRIFGRDHVLDVCAGGRYGIDIGDDTVSFRVRAGSTPAERERFIKKKYKELLEKELSKRIPLWEARAGLRCSGWHIRDMKSRWGSCNTRSGELCFNLRLAEYDTELLDYVILHELAHIRYANHGKDYWALVSSFMPDCKKRRKDLNSYAPKYRPVTPRENV